MKCIHIWYNGLNQYFHFYVPFSSLAVMDQKLYFKTTLFWPFLDLCVILARHANLLCLIPSLLDVSNFKTTLDM